MLLLAPTQRSTVLVSDLIAGLWLLPLGYLVIRSLFIPAAVGWLLLISGASWLALLFTDILLPGLGQVASYLPLGAVGEVAFMGWLLIKGAGAPSGTRSPRRPGTSAP